MKISKEFIKKLQGICSQPNGNLPLCSSNAGFFPRLFQQTKEKSQIIAYIWRWGSDDSLLNQDGPNRTNFQNAQKLAECFENITENANNSELTLTNLLSNVPQSNGTEIEQLLYAVFPFNSEADYPPGYFFPIFNTEEIEYYGFVIDVNAFEGVINDPTHEDPKVMRMVIPYPPCPQFSGITVTKDELEAWIENRNEEQMISENPYIPTCTS